MFQICDGRSIKQIVAGIGTLLVKITELFSQVTLVALVLLLTGAAGRADDTAASTPRLGSLQGVAEIYARSGSNYERKREFGHALDQYEEAIKLLKSGLQQPANRTAERYLLIGSAELAAARVLTPQIVGQRNGAARILSRGLRDVYLRDAIGDLEQARRLDSLAVKAAGGQPDPLTWRIQANLGYAYLMNNDVERGTNAFADSYRLNPRFSAAQRVVRESANKQAQRAAHQARLAAAKHIGIAIIDLALPGYGPLLVAIGQLAVTFLPQ